MFEPKGLSQTDAKHMKARILAGISLFVALLVLVTPSLVSVVNDFIENIPEPEVMGESEKVVSAELEFVDFLPSAVDFDSVSSESVIKKFSTQIHEGDGRAIVLRAYFDIVKCGDGSVSPLADYTDVLVSSADKYGMDWKLTTAIAGVETWFGCAGGADDYKNAWGYGGGPSTRMRYSSWPEAIDDYTKSLAEGYGTNMHKRLYDVASYYVRGVDGEHNPWADGVTKYMGTISYLESQML